MINLLYNDIMNKDIKQYYSYNKVGFMKDLFDKLFSIPIILLIILILVVIFLLFTKRENKISYDWKTP